jgi:hypothetical protein
MAIIATPDSLLAVNDTIQPDSLKPKPFYFDSAGAGALMDDVNHQSPFVSADKPVVYDVQHMRTTPNRLVVFIILLVLITVVTYLRVAFAKDLDELISSFRNSNLAHQVYRTKTGGVSFTELFLDINFVVAISVYVRFVIMHFYRFTTLESTSSTFFIIFLFTFFYFGKMIALKVIGYAFEIKEEVDEYIFNYTLMAKILGLALIPVLLVFAVSQQKFFNFVLALSVLLIVSCVFMGIARGLSTSYKLMYRSVHHFFIYVCIVEISPVFLIFKLLTKTII